MRKKGLLRRVNALPLLQEVAERVAIAIFRKASDRFRGAICQEGWISLVGRPPCL